MNSLGEFLRDQGAITEEALREALAVQNNRSLPMGVILVEMGATDEPTVARAQAKQSRMPFVDLAGKTPPSRLTDLLDAQSAWDLEAIPVAEKGAELVVAISDPSKAVVADTLRFLLDRDIRMAMTTPSALGAALEKSYGAKQSGGTAAPVSTDEAESDEAPVVRLVRKMFEDAVASRASDIHIEPFHGTVRVRFRVDGALQVYAEHPVELFPALMSHLKVSAGLDIAEKRKPQDGRIGMSVNGSDLDIRVSILPTNHGESCVMRLLDREANLISLQELGLDAEAQDWFRSLIERPNGIFLVTGPTGSGKTTTLYAALQTLNRPDKKILTVEDPVEYRISGINQVQVHPHIGLDFSRALRAFLRQAPNVILVGEIRDRETAEVAIQASLTGHIVFSTVHTNDAPSAVTRLLDMGVPPFLVATSLQGVLAQRLVRRLCPKCSREQPADALACQVLGLKEGDTMTVSKGCAHCGRTGYYGRVGVFERLEMNAALRDSLFQMENSSDFLKSATGSSRYTPLLTDAIAKARAGLTSVSEVLRVTSVDTMAGVSATSSSQDEASNS